MSVMDTRSALGPLTTAFTVPDSCSNIVQAQGEGHVFASQGQSCSVSSLSSGWSDINVDDATCWPPVTTTTPLPPLMGWGFYSPGLSCPYGWTSACTAALSSNGHSSPIIDGTSFTFQYQPTAGETAVGCCPIGYSCFGINPENSYQACLSRASSTQFSRVTCTDGQFTTQPFELPNTYVASTSSDDAGSPVSTLTQVLDAMSLYAPLIQINWKDSDLGIVSTSTSPSPSPSPTPTSPPTVIASASMPASSTTSAIIVSTESPSQSSSKGLATGAKVAVGIIIPIVCLSAAGMVMLILHRRKNKRIPRPRAAKPATLLIKSSTLLDKPQLDTDSGKVELSATTNPLELQSGLWFESFQELSVPHREPSIGGSIPGRSY